jgi:hypothetical protein
MDSKYPERDCYKDLPSATSQISLDETGPDQTADIPGIKMRLLTVATVLVLASSIAAISVDSMAPRQACQVPSIPYRISTWAVNRY